MKQVTKTVTMEMKHGPYRRNPSEKKTAYLLTMTEAEKQELYELSVKKGCTMVSVLLEGIQLVKEKMETENE